MVEVLERARLDKGAKQTNEAVGSVETAGDSAVIQARSQQDSSPRSSLEKKKGWETSTSTNTQKVAKRPTSMQAPPKR